MNCSEFRQDVDALAAGELSELSERSMREHASHCGPCAESLAAAVFVADQIKQDRSPEPDPEFETRVLGKALGHHQQKQTNRWHTPLWGSAVAAALVIGIFVGGQWSQGPGQGSKLAEENAITPVANDEAQQKLVRLAFTSKEAVENVTLTLELPPNMELAPFPGRHRVSWKVSLKPGDNLLALPVNILFPGEGSLVAHLGEGEKRKTFRTDIGKLTEPSS